MAILPGSHFGRPDEELTARLAYVDFDGAQALAASEGISLDEQLNGEFLEAYCVGVLAAIDKICEWYQG